jgi:predicted RecA/RadA family phage recombinase
MMARFIKGELAQVIDYSPPSVAVSAGDVLVIGDLVAVARLDIAVGGTGQLHLCGIYDIAKSTSGGSGQVAGTTFYWDATNHVATTSASGNKLLGKSELVCADADTTVRVVLEPWGTVSFSPLSSGIADPGASGAIPVTNSGHVELVTAGAETRTIAAPTFLGQELLISFKTKVGNCVITVTTTVNVTGNNTITFSAVQQAVRLQAVATGSNIRWSVVSADGAALSTV